MSRTRAHSPGVKAAILVSGVARQKRQTKLGLWNSLCTTEPTLLEVTKWLSKVHYAHIQLDSRSRRDVMRLSNKRSPYLFGVATANRTKVTTPNKYGAEIIARMSDWENDEVTSNIVYWAMKSRTGSVDAYPIPCNPQFELQQTNHSQDLWHQVDLLRYRVNHSIFYTSH